MNRKNRILLGTSVLGTVILLCTSMVTVNSCAAAVVWSDNFNDGDYTGWTVEMGTFSAADTTLRATTAHSVIRHDTSVTHGTWRFDLDVAPGTTGVYVHPFAATVDGSNAESTYTLAVNNYHWRFIRRTGSIDTQLDEYDPTESVEGWYHIDITRDAGGQFYLFINGTHRMNALDTIENTANYFVFYSRAQEALDNVVISDTVDIAAPTTPGTTGTGTGTTPPPPIPGFPLVAIIVGVTLAVGVGVTLRPRRLNS